MSKINPKIQETEVERLQKVIKCMSREIEILSAEILEWRGFEAWQSNRSEIYESCFNALNKVKRDAYIIGYCAGSNYSKPAPPPLLCAEYYASQLYPGKSEL